MVSEGSSDRAEQKKTRLLIADDHLIIIEGIRRALADYPEFEIAGMARSGVQALQMAESLKPDLVILDLGMPDMDGFEASLRIKEACPQARILVFSMFRDDRIGRLLEAGIAGYVSKEEPTSELISALRSIKADRPYFSTGAVAAQQGFVSKTDEKSLLPTLSSRERQVFVLLANGFTLREIAAKLRISPKTVESHKYNIMLKLNITSPTQLTKLAVRMGLIEI